MTKALLFAGLLACCCCNTARAQFSPMLLQNASYWGDGKAEFDLYNAQLIRDGQPRQCEVELIFTPQFVDPSTLLLATDPKAPGMLPTIRMNEVATLPRGLFVEQMAITALWRMDAMSLARMDCAGSDSIGNLMRRAEEKRDGDKATWIYSAQTYREKVEAQSVAAPAGTMLFYDELPLRVRTIDFRKNDGGFDVQLAPSLVTADKQPLEFKPAKIAWKIGERGIEVTLQHAKGTDTFRLDRDFPFLLREWKMADGSNLKMKRSIRADYWNYGKNGDRERALNNPMLQHPD